MPKMIIKGRVSGMFAEVNCFLNALAFADYQGYEPAISWVRCRYSRKNENGWPVFFHHLDSSEDVVMKVENRCSIFRPAFAYASPRGPKLPQWYRKKYRCPDFLFPPSDRHLVGALIDKYIEPKPLVMDAVKQHDDRIGGARKVIGLHIRGPLRLHGGSAWLSDQLGKGRPPYEEYFQYVDRELGERDLIVLCTDAGCVADTVRKRYGGRVIVPSQHLPDDGEPHQKNKTADKHDLGVDVLSDAYILAKSDVFIHGNSNVSNYVLCLSPDMKHHDIYGHLYPEV